MNILQNPQYVWWLLASAVIGGILTWTISGLIHRSRRLEALRTLETQLAGNQVQLEDLRNQLDALQQEYDETRKEFRLMEMAKVSAETKLTDTQQHIESQRVMLGEAKLTLADTFRSLASEALAGNNQGFLALAEEKFKALKDETTHELDHRHNSLEALVNPLSEILRTYQQETKALEDKRLREFSTVSEQLKQLATAQSTLQSETSKTRQCVTISSRAGSMGRNCLAQDSRISRHVGTL